MNANPIYPDAKRPNTFQDGLEFQDYVVDILTKEIGLPLSNYSSKKWQYNVGENKQGVEIKLDNRCTETNRLSIEIAEKSRASMPNYTMSGIYRDDNTWLYVHGNREIFFIFPKRYLVMLHRKNLYKEKTMPTIKTFYLPMPDAEYYALISFRNGIKKMNKVS